MRDNNVETQRDVYLDITKLKGFQSYKKHNDTSFSLWDYIFCATDAETAIIFTTLFWPDFVEHENCIFLKRNFDINLYEHWKTELMGDIVAIEKVINHVHVDELFSISEVGMTNLIYLSKRLTEMWENRVKSLYPQRNFQTVCDSDDATAVITIYQNTIKQP